MDIEQVVTEMPKAENPHQAFRDALRRITPLTELGNTRNLQLKSLTTMQEALDSSNLACACARWGAFEEGSDARAKLLAEQGYRKVRSVDEIHEKILEVLIGIDSAEEGVEEFHRWLLEGE